MYHLVPATLADIPELLLLINSAYRGDASREGWTTEADLLEGSIRTDTEHLTGLMGRPDAVILKAQAEEDGALAGCVFLEKHDRRLYLGMLSVSPKRQGGGIGKRLLQGAEAYAREKGCATIYMQVISVRQEIIAWYERHGYRLTGARKPFDAPLKFGVPTQPLEFVILEKTI